MSCEGLGRAIAEQRARILEYNEAICEIVEEFRKKGWKADAFFSQDGKICVVIKKGRKAEECL